MITILVILGYLAVAAVIQVWAGRHWVYDYFEPYGWGDDDRRFAFVWAGMVAIFWPISVWFVLVSIARNHIPKHNLPNPIREIPNAWSRRFIEPKDS